MKNRKTDRALLGISTGGFMVMSASLLLLPLDMTALVSSLFWGGLLLGAVFQIILAARRKTYLSEQGSPAGKKKKAHIGLITFGANVAAWVADILLVCSVIATVVIYLITKGYGYICCVCLTLVLATFSLHCILNGRIFAMLTSRKRTEHRRREATNSSDKGETK